MSGAPRGPAASSTAPTASAVNLANALTLVRFVLVPVFAIALFVDDGHDHGWRIVACAIFAAASLTDRVDGDLARRRGTVTEFGKLADPLADKALTGAALVSLSVLNLLPWWVTVVILGREIAVTGLRLWVIRHGVLPASRGGKWKTFVQAIAIGLYLLPLHARPHLLAVTVMAVAIVITIATGIDYVSRAVTLHRTPRGGTTPA